MLILPSRFSIPVVLLATIVLGCIVSYGWALFSLQLEQAGVPTRWIGYAGTAQLLAILLNTLLLPFFLYRMRLIRLQLIATTLGVAAYAGLWVAGNDMWLHIPLRFVLGCGINCCFILYEYWLNSSATDRNRGKVMALYCTSVVIGMSIGPRLVPLLQAHHMALFAVGTGLFMLALLLVASVRHHGPQAHEQPPAASPWGIILVTPIVAVVALMFGMTESTYWAFMTIYGMRNGLGVDDATLMLSLISMGGMVAQLPMGALADRFSPRFTVLLATGVGAAGGLMLPQLVQTGGMPLWIHMFVWGGIITTIYTCAIILLGHEHKGANLANATLAFQMMYGMGNIVGPAMSGNAIEYIGIHAVPWVMGLACAITFVFTALQYTRKP